MQRKANTINQRIFIALSQSKNSQVKQMINQISTDIYQFADQENHNVLHIAVKNKNRQMVQYFLNLFDQFIFKNPQKFTNQRKKLFVNQYDKQGFTPLHYAAFNNTENIAFILQNHGADIKMVNQQGLNILHIAAQNNSISLLYYYYNKGISIHQTDNKGCTPLHWACYSGQQQASSALIALKSKLDIQQNRQGMTPLHLAVISANGRLVKKLLLKGANRNISDFSNKLPLDYAKQNNYATITEMIVDKRGISQFLNVKTPFRKVTKHQASFFFFIINFGVVSFLNIWAVFPLLSYLNQQQDYQQKENIFKTIFLIFVFIDSIIFIFLYISDPGYLNKNKSFNFNQITMKINPEKICFDCQIIKPDRSKHCQICNSCICVYDHHCPWIGNCIGANNYLMFYCFIFLIFISLLMLITLELKVMIKYFQFTQGFFINLFQWIIIIYSLIISFFFQFAMILLIYVQSYNCFTNKTTYQAYNNKPSHRNNNQLYNCDNKNLNQSLLQDQQVGNSSQMKQSLLMSEKENKENKKIQKQLQNNNSQQQFFSFKNTFKNCKKMLYQNKTNKQYQLVQFESV